MFVAWGFLQLTQQLSNHLSKTLLEDVIPQQQWVLERRQIPGS